MVLFVLVLALYRQVGVLESRLGPRAALELASQHDCASVAAPALSCGVYGYPIDLASRIALGTTRDFLLQDANVRLVRFVLFGEGAYGAFSAALEELSV
ncbi:macro domain-containing protein [uncultured Arthrobacter sp.]|uniref:macro domain-containing protein n=1 Tax=uncultured Arthrobacter sp. TaxID=114050 RepID=UPI0032164BF8